MSSWSSWQRRMTCNCKMMLRLTGQKLKKEMFLERIKSHHKKCLLVSEKTFIKIFFLTLHPGSCWVQYSDLNELLHHKSGMAGWSCAPRHTVIRPESQLKNHNRIHNFITHQEPNWFSYQSDNCSSHQSFNLNSQQMFQSAQHLKVTQPQFIASQQPL